MLITPHDSFPKLWYCLYTIWLSTGFMLSDVASWVHSEDWNCWPHNDTFRGSFPLLISENGVLILCAMTSSIIREWAVTFPFFNTSVKTQWTDDFGIWNSATISSQAVCPSPSKMVAIMAANMLSIELLGLAEHPGLHYYPYCDETTGTNMELLVTTHFSQQLINLCSDRRFQFWWTIFDPVF